MRHYGIGPQVACAILAAATRGASLPRAKPCASPAWTSPCTSLTPSAAPATSPAKDRRCCGWAAFEAAESACEPASPDHAYYLELKERVGANRAVLSVARKLLRRAHHTLRQLGDDAIAPAA